MTQVSLPARVIIRNDTAQNWVAANSVLLRGEMGVEVDTHKFKFGDGTTKWNQLDYASAMAAVVKGVNPTSADYDYECGTLWVNTTDDTVFSLVDNTASSAKWKRLVTSEDIAGLSSGDMHISKYANQTGAGESTGKVNHSLQADKLAAARTISLSGDVTGSASFDGSQNAAITATLKNSGVTAGTYLKVTVNSKGLITGFQAITVDDIPSLPNTKITGLGTAATKNTGTAAGTVPILGSDGKLDTKVIPDLALMDVFEANTEAEMLAMAVQRGDVCLRYDEPPGMFILMGEDPKKIADWRRIPVPGNAVLSVNGKIGVIVLKTDDVSEGSTNLYWTQTRFNTAFTAKSTNDLKEGSTNKYYTDARVKGYLEDTSNLFILNGGTASGH